MHNHEETQLPGPPHARQVLGVVVMLIAVLLLIGWIPFGLTTMVVAMALIGAALIL